MCAEHKEWNSFDQQGAYLLADKLLPHEFSGLKHVGNVIKWAETLVLVLDLFLKEQEN